METDFLTDISVRKNGGSKGGSAYKAHMSYYSHIRKMKKRNLSMNIDDCLCKLDVTDINSDLECVINVQNKNKKMFMTPRHTIRMDNNEMTSPR
jgi:hypothetical protein